MIVKMMDPKMDSGLLLYADDSKEEYDVLQDLSPEQLLGIMDQLLCFEVRPLKLVMISFGHESSCICLQDVISPRVSFFTEPFYFLLH